ncbi:NERD nuclease [Bacillus sp. AFS002410]|uniref:nuclease-related domain-containing protein n=1 Tax=Bacillus sp. AFS002410 TaxID=2033481 RepID=UPI000BF116F9|nr:nuclease-related domain-containing protein [Bacillus sp. AFS002410]PEJ58514.1 NERD nuclease [Bacillus sp. AFS002410]
MILKERTVPLIIKKLEALLRRLPNNHPQWTRIEEDLFKYKAGYHGEKSLDYHLSFFPKESSIILHDLRLVDDFKHFFQIDTIIITPRLLIIIEVKNLIGTLYFDQTFNQFIRIIDGKEESFTNPIIQVERQKRQLTEWLRKHNFKNLCVIPYVVVSNPKTIIKASINQSEIAKKVFHSELLYKKVEELEIKFKTDLYTQKEIRKLAKLLIKQHQLLDQNILDKYNISSAELLTGVLCSNCSQFTMERDKGNWICNYCLHDSKEAHIGALVDYLLLIGNTIKNKQARDFLHIPSIYNASRLLSKLNLTTSGTKKDKTHYLDELSQQSSY